MQYNSCAIRSQSVLTTNSTGRVYNVQFECRAQLTSEIASIACLDNFFRCALLSCSEILTYQLLGSQLWIVLSTENSIDRQQRHRSLGKQITNYAITRDQTSLSCCSEVKTNSLAVRQPAVDNFVFIEIHITNNSHPGELFTW